MPRVWNKRDPGAPKNAQYVGRPTSLGNPYSHLANSLAAYRTKTVKESIVRFDEYARNRARKEPKFKRAILALYNEDLICWCAPDGGIDVFDERLICHAQTLGRLAKEFHDEEFMSHFGERLTG